MASTRLPATVLSGFIGAGKTTLLNHIIADRGEGAGEGDRRQELVFIGIDMDRGWIERELGRCLVPEADFQPARWAGLADPFPAWGRQADAA